MVGKALLLFTMRLSQSRFICELERSNPIPPTCTYSLEKVGLARGGGLDQRLLALHKKNEERTIQYKCLIGFYQNDCQMNAMPGNFTCSSSLQFLCQKNCAFLSVLLLEQFLTAFEVGATHSGYCVSLPSL